MRTIEIRRHAHTKKGEARERGSHLSAEGVRAARSLGDRCGPFANVYTSDIPRTLETAVAMGLAVDGQISDLANMRDDFWQEVGRHDHWSWDAPYLRYVELIEKDGAVARIARRQVELWREFVEGVLDGARVLVVSHGHAMEAGLVAAVDGQGVESFGRPFSHLEGVILEFREGSFRNPRIQRFTSDPPST